MLDKYMCTDKCPCKDYKEDGKESTADYRKNPAIMTKKSRSFDKMIFTKGGFKSFDDCYEAWEKKAENDPSIDLA